MATLWMNLSKLLITMGILFLNLIMLPRSGIMGVGTMPKLGILKKIEKDHGSFMNFKEKFVDSALSLFGSGWVWLVLMREEKELRIVKTSNAICPLVWTTI